MRNRRKMLPFKIFLASIAILFVLAGCGNGQQDESDSSKNDEQNTQADVAQEEQSGQSGQAEEDGKLESADGKNPIVTIEMNDGQVIKMELYPDVAPNTVANFISLVEDGFYDGTIFHRVIPEFMIQGGDPVGNGTGGPGYGIKGEFSSNGFENNLAHKRGVVSMARSGHPDSAGSQFFIVVADSPHLDGLYASFGKVIEGMDVVDEIVNVKTNGEKPLEDQVMKKVTVETFGVDYPEVEKVE